MGTDPIWQNPSFIDLFFDVLRESKPKPKPLAANAFTHAAELLFSTYSTVVSNNPDWLTGLTSSELTSFTLFLPALAELKMNARSFVLSKSDKSLYDGLQDITSRLRMMTMNTFMIIPAGWANPTTGGHNILFVIHRGKESFSLAVCNTGEGVKDYHPISPEFSPDMKYKLFFVVDEIPLQRLLDSSWWFVIYKMQVCSA
jgi:hypothetical protein